MPDALSLVHALTFDAFGTILDLGGSHAPRLAEFLKAKGSQMTAAELWARWRYRQRIEQYQDNQFYTGHYGYLDSSRRALIYTLRAAKLAFVDGDVALRARATSTNLDEASTRWTAYPCSASHNEYAPAAPPTSTIWAGGRGRNRPRISFVRSNSSREGPDARRDSSGKVA